LFLVRFAGYSPFREVYKGEREKREASSSGLQACRAN
jgi:hypothetical protein